MKLEGTYTFDAPKEVVWPMLQDPNVLAQVLPGCEKLTESGENQYNGVLNVKVGPVQGKFNGMITINDVVPLEGYSLVVDGNGPAGFVKGTGQLRLEGNGDSTTMHYSGDVQVGGRLASVGQRLLDTSAKAIVRQSLDGLDKHVQAQMEVKASPDAVTATPPTIEAPSQTEFALGVARNFFDELVPQERRGNLAMALLVVAAAFWLLRGWRRRRLYRLAEQVAAILAEKQSQ